MMDAAAWLISGYCDDSLLEQERREFAVWLRDDSAHMERFAREFRLHSRLYDLLRQQQLQSNAWSDALEEGARSVGSLALVNTSPPSAKNIWRTLVLATVAATLAIVAAVFVLGPTGDKVVAQVSSGEGAAVASDGQNVQPGALLATGEVLRVDRGHLVVTFECGARVRLEAPAVLQIEDSSTGELIQGDASVRVPTQAIGFAIHTPLASIIDLGTEFRVQLFSDDHLELHVFDGLVEVDLNERFDHADSRPLMISEGHSTRFDAAAGEIVNLEYIESLKTDF